MANESKTAGGFCITQIWPDEPFASQAQCIPTNPFLAAATLTAMVAYPHRKYHRSGTSAEDYVAALLAYFQRIARGVGKLDTLPIQAKLVRKHLMENRIRAGEARLVRTLKVLELIETAFLSAMETSAIEKGEAVTIRFERSPDLSHAEFTLVLDGTLNFEPASHSFRSVILKHRSAFGAWTGDENTIYQNILTRFVNPVIEILPIALLVRSVLFEKIEEANTRNLFFGDILVRQCEWAENIQSKLIAHRLYAQTILHGLKRPACDCRFVQIDQSE